ncbi:hypothetical protein VSDG_06889 [Cytospora chrysosperma]|uniref:Uncharacterized protein n=1 Tax=Cytospora chrysosperma TaxID=252740 RepID=A0A423VQN3_CYTCH|nr:hypothetical protein VSDG_06889 [Valsa sordida]
MTPTGVHINEPARETGTVKCWIWPEANEYWIGQGIDYLNEVPGKPSNGPGPGECGRVSCSWSAAIWWCNDNNHQYELDSFWEIAQAAQDIDSDCHYVDPLTLRVYTSGQNFFKENWKTAASRFTLRLWTEIYLYALRWLVVAGASPDKPDSAGWLAKEHTAGRLSIAVIAVLRLRQVLNDYSRSTTATVANTSNTNLGLLLLEYRRQGGDNTGSRASQRVTNGNGAAEDVDLLSVEAQQLHVGQGNDGESLVDLVEVNLLGGDAGVLDGLGDGQRGGGRELLRCVGGVTPAEDLGDGLDAQLLQLGLGDQDDGASTVVDGGGVGGGDGAGARDEDWPGSLELVDVQVLDLVITLDLDGRLATAAADLDRGNLALEDTGLGGSLGLLVGLDGVFVLVLTGDAVGGGAQLSLHAHELLLAVGVPQTVLLHAINQGAVAVLDTGAQVGEVVRGVGHGLGTTSNNDISVAGHDGLGTQDDGLHAGRADLVNRRAHNGIAEATVDGTLTGRSLTQA